MSVLINASTSSGIGLTPDNSGVIQFQSNGSNTVQIAANGTMTTPSGIVVTSATGVASGALIRAPQVLTSGTSYTTPATCTSIYVEAVGGGGGGGGADSSQGAGGGGGSGAYCASYFAVASNTSYTYAIGAGGSGGAATGTNGTAGGNTTFTVNAVTITSGGGGFGRGTVGNNQRQTLAFGGEGGSATNGDLNTTGNPGIWGFATLGDGSLDIEFQAGGNGGSSFFGGGGRGAVTLFANVTGTTIFSTIPGTFGGGGGGAASPNNTGLAGGAGGNGLIRIWEFT